MFLVLAQSADPWGVVLGGGGTVALSILFIYGFWKRWWVVGSHLEEAHERERRLQERVEEKDAKIDHLQTKVQEDVIPLVVTSANLLEHFASMVNGGDGGGGDARVR